MKIMKIMKKCKSQVMKKETGQKEDDADEAPQGTEAGNLYKLTHRMAR